jgi:hypothetical protein
MPWLLAVPGALESLILEKMLSYLKKREARHKGITSFTQRLYALVFQTSLLFVCKFLRLPAVGVGWLVS